jgi:hypothetical protein
VSALQLMGRGWHRGAADRTRGAYSMLLLHPGDGGRGRVGMIRDVSRTTVATVFLETNDDDAVWRALEALADAIP